MATKTSEEVAAAFKRITTRARGRSRLRAVNEIPGEASTDGGAEFKNTFEDLLEAEKISHRLKESTNSLALVDAAIRTLRATMALAVLALDAVAAAFATFPEADVVVSMAFKTVPTSADVIRVPETSGGP